MACNKKSNQLTNTLYPLSPTTGKEMKLGPGFMGKVAMLPSAVQALFSDISSDAPRKLWNVRRDKEEPSAALACSGEGDRDPSLRVRAARIAKRMSI
eukprot:scaffold421687_cov51-Prasinocladus_malaysianus.AAC.3